MRIKLSEMVLQYKNGSSRIENSIRNSLLVDNCKQIETFEGCYDLNYYGKFDNTIPREIKGEERFEFIIRLLLRVLTKITI